MHRQCLPNGLSSTDYVLLKKNNEPFQLNRVKCAGGVVVSAASK